MREYRDRDGKIAVFRLCSSDCNDVVLMDLSRRARPKGISFSI
jgi:hypothetical protein